VVLCTFIFTFLVVGKTEENGSKHSVDLVLSFFGE
jgi:hypothetical protein